MPSSPQSILAFMRSASARAGARIDVEIDVHHRIDGAEKVDEERLGLFLDAVDEAAP